MTIKHTWDEPGGYQVKVKAKNENGLESEWMPEYKEDAFSFIRKSSSIFDLINYIFLISKYQLFTSLPIFVSKA